MIWDELQSALYTWGKSGFQMIEYNFQKDLDGFKGFEHIKQHLNSGYWSGSGFVQTWQNCGGGSKQQHMN